MRCKKLEIVIKDKYMKRILISLLGCSFVSQQMLAQTDSIASRHELKNVTVKATNGLSLIHI